MTPYYDCKHGHCGHAVAGEDEYCSWICELFDGVIRARDSPARAKAIFDLWVAVGQHLNECEDEELYCDQDCLTRKGERT